MSACWNLASAIIPASRRTLLYGPPGTGKTFAGIYLRPEGTEVFVNTLTEDMPVAELRGHFIKAADGGFSWMHGPGCAAWLAGGRYVINEINRASPEVHTFLYAILDDPESAHITLPNGERIHPAEGFSVVATMNGEPEELPEALQDRFSVQIEIDEIHPDALARVEPRFQRIAQALANAQGGAARRVSVRRWLDIQELLSQGVSQEQAFTACFGSRAGEILRDLKAEQIKEAQTTQAKPTEDQGAWGKTGNLSQLLGVEGAQATDAPPCPSCGGDMVRRARRTDNRPFWGCRSFPSCRGTVEIAP